MPNQVLDKITLRRNGIDEPYFISNSTNGYYNSTDGKFYKESTFTTEIQGISRLVYIDLSTDYIYRYDDLNTEFIQIGGSGSGLEYVDILPSSPDIKDAIYGHYSTDSYSETVAQDFLDENEFFVKTDDDYAPKGGIDLTVSDDDTTYKALVSLALSGSDYEATYNDSTTHTFADGDTFYFKVGSMKFYAGDETNQVLYLLTGTGGGGGGAEYIPGEGIDISNNVLSVKPATTSTLGGIKPDDETIKVNNNGILSGNYQGGYGINITDNTIKAKAFVGTQAEWNALTTDEKANFDTVSITDDGEAEDTNPGHEVLESSGTALPQRNKMQFNDMTVTDDSANDKTIVAPVPYTAGSKIDITNHEISVDDSVTTTFTGTQAEWDALTSTEKSEYEIVNITDDVANGGMVVVDTVEDGNLNPPTSSSVYHALELNNIIPKNAGARNSIFRGQYLGSEVTSEQYDAINAGTFDGLFIGDYWTIGGVDYEIADFDYWMRTGNTECTIHHAVIVPKTNMYTAKMNNSNVTTDGYTGSKMYTANLADAKTAINTAFGSAHILSHRELFTNAVTSDKASGWAWYDSTVDLMNECMVYGHCAWASHPGYETGIDKSQLSLFRLRPERITNRANWWLRSVVSSANFARVASDGLANHGGAAAPIGVRPAFAIIG